MQPLTFLESTAVVLARDNIDTDQIIPARFLTTTDRSGLGRYAFYDWRYDPRGEPISDFVLNSDHGAQILVAGRNFGCGSSREHAPWALLDAGFRIVISSEIADIFASNSLKNGLLPVVVSQEVLNGLLGHLATHPQARLSVDVASLRLNLPNVESVTFALDPFAQHCLLEGVDPLGFLLAQMGDIQQYEENRHAR